MNVKDLKPGMEVGVSSRYLEMRMQYSHIGPQRAVITALNQYEKPTSDSTRRKAKQQVTIYNRDGTLYRENVLLDGKNIVGPWSDFKANIELKWEAILFEEKKASIERQIAEEKKQTAQALCQRIYVLASALGITAETREINRYYSNVAFTNEDNLQRLEEILQQSIKGDN